MLGTAYTVDAMTNETELAAQVAELQEALAALTRRVQKIEGKLPSDVQAAADWLAYKSAGG
ncbi:Uncharacterised protein [Mycobacteroides abscessus subsp. massiliense]|uniref:Uncharacterized protein n=2 Tax=Mycobacteroides abscessus TaxID=36809 RepID=A0A1T9M4F6_9MYCO|nr:hypothetical protein A3O04_05930 [Mycobacteroides abscessus]ARQ63673.1 hypothetical protein CAK77_05830 [Mycobacteroides abscessus subsp. massiliense]EHM19815.1 hypothetical protein MMAS_11000 [Mycobacteroides abscessus subsp. massiliense CCUG 48898 = JCM 15300]SIM38736.1 Uncharacterised protein [Mycobacteroides abscessus subsp. bolletii]EIV67654.1 hypothetical protein MMCCUG48898_0986 [Mycobacteroides abscessus subsp. massiliense CCUG 48898 = JCM 15300]